MSRPNWHRHLDSRGVIAIFGVILFWGAVPVMLRELSGSLDSWTANAIRFPLSAILYWPVLIYFHRRGMLTRSVVRRCAIPTACVMVGQMFWAMAPYYLPASSIGFMARMTLVFTILFAFFFIREERLLLRVPSFYVGLLVSTFGFLLLSFSQSFSSPGVEPFGVVCMLVCGACLGMYSVSVRLFLTGIHPLLCFGVISQFVSLGLLIASFIFGDWSVVPNLTAATWELLVVSSILGIAISHALLYVAIHRLGASISSGIQNAAPFVTAILAAAFLDEELTGMQMFGGVAIIIGAIWLLKSHVALKERAAIEAAMVD